MLLLNKLEFQVRGFAKFQTFNPSALDHRFTSSSSSLLIVYLFVHRFQLLLLKQEHVDRSDSVAFGDLLGLLFYVTKGVKKEESWCPKCKLDSRAGKQANTNAAGLMNR